MAARHRPRPRTKRQPAKSRLRPCVYQPDPTLPDPRDPAHPLCGQAGCGLPQRHPRHTPPDTSAEQAVHRARAGDDT